MTFNLDAKNALFCSLLIAYPPGLAVLTHNNCCFEISTCLIVGVQMIPGEWYMVIGDCEQNEDVSVQHSTKNQ